MDLLQVPVLAEFAADILGPFGLDAGFRRQAVEALGDRVHQPVVVHITRRREDHGVARVVAADEVGDHTPLHVPDDLRAPQHGSADGLVREGGFLEVVEDDVVGRVLRLADLLKDDRPLPRQLRFIEGRVHQDVGDQIDGEVRVLPQHPGVVGRLLARGVGVR